LQQRGKGLGIIRLDDSLAALVQSGRITIEAALAVAEAPAELEARLNGGQPATAAMPGRQSVVPEEPAPDRISEAPDSPKRQSFFERAGALLGKRGS
jgi:hypothetical protein